jgi:hypothetical protein
MDWHWNRLFLFRGPSRISPGSFIPPLFHSRTPGGVRRCQPGSVFLQHPPGVFSEVTVLQNINLKVKPASTAMLPGSVWLITGKMIPVRSHKLIVLYTQRHIPSNTQGSSATCSTSNDATTREYKRRVEHSFHCDVYCYCCSWIRHSVRYSFTAAICIRNKPYNMRRSKFRSPFSGISARLWIKVNETLFRRYGFVTDFPKQHVMVKLTHSQIIFQIW